MCRARKRPMYPVGWGGWVRRCGVGGQERGGGERWGRT